MSNVDVIMKLARENNGMITSALVDKVGVSRGSLKYAVDKGLLERTSRGVYVLPNAWEDELFCLQSRYKKGIFSHETVLFLYDLTDRTPNRFDMTFPNTYNLSSVKKESVNCSQAKEPLYSLGVIKMKTPFGNEVKGYCVEKTLCDILKTRRNTDIQVVADAFKRYTKWKSKNIPLLSEYAKQLKVEKRLRNYLEVLL